MSDTLKPIPIDVQRWAEGPDGPRLLGQRSREEVCRHINSELERLGLAREMEYDFGPAAFTVAGAPFPERFRWIACFAVRGGSEGFYVHVETIDGDRRELVYLAKCFDWDLAWRVARVAAECLDL